MSEPTDGDALLAKIKPQLRRIRTQICLQPNLLEEWEDVEAALAEAEAATGNRLNGEKAKAPKKLTDQLKAIEKKINDSSPWFTFEAMPVEKYQALVSKHPPRENDQVDVYYGHNREAVIMELVRACMVDPVFSDEGWREFMATCAPSEWGALRDAVQEVNGGSVKPPKFRRASRRVRESASASE